ncbi:hypothetical protein [Lysinibacillus sp. NPDC096212]|uniref:hypothetical protein n=1 Tax=Lysinibacillus sp. NPDC096212 TaxID=3364135 RepID=UPI003824D823
MYLNIKDYHHSVGLISVPTGRFLWGVGATDILLRESEAAAVADCFFARKRSDSSSRFYCAKAKRQQQQVLLRESEATAAAGFIARKRSDSSSRLVTKALSQDVTILVFVPLPALRQCLICDVNPQGVNQPERRSIYIRGIRFNKMASNF